MLNRTALSKNERKSLLRAGHCARLFERSVGVIFLIQPRGASFAAPCSKQIGLKWQAMFDRVLAICDTSKRTERLFLFVPSSLLLSVGTERREKKDLKNNKQQKRKG